MKSIITTELCSSCNAKIATHISAKGNLWCEDNSSKCPAIKINIGKINKDILTSIDPSTGMSKAKKLAIDRRSIAASNGKCDPYKLAAIAMATTRKSNGSYSTDFSNKVLDTKRRLDDDGLSIIDKSTKKMVETRRQLDKDGYSSYQRAAIKSTNTRLLDIDAKGLNGFDRMWIKGGQAKEYLGTSLYYRSKLEELFLNKLKEENSINWIIDNVKNCKSIDYIFDNKIRKYIPDYIIGNNLYEIKSSYTLDNFGKNLELRLKNIAKLNAALNIGFTVILVLDEYEHIWKEYRNVYE